MSEELGSTYIFDGDVLEVVSQIDDHTFDGCFCDPPYGLDFMGKAWDHGVPSAEVWAEIMRTLKPGAHLLAFGGTRTFHRLAVNIEDAGFEIRDCFMWLYGSGMATGYRMSRGVDDPKWEGYRTKLKAAWEPIIVAMKPKDGTYAENAVKHGVAGLNVDSGRIGTSGGGTTCTNRDDDGNCLGHSNSWETVHPREAKGAEGRYPANLICDEAIKDSLYPDAHDKEDEFYFYCPKASKSEREAGLLDVEKSDGGTIGYPRCKKCGRQKVNTSGACECDEPEWEQVTKSRKRANTHPCVKPLDLCRYFTKIMLPPAREDGLRRLLVPFSGSGSEMIGARMAGWDQAIGIELEDEYIKIAKARIKHWEND